MKLSPSQLKVLKALAEEVANAHTCMRSKTFFKVADGVQVMDRKKGIGGTDISAIVGLNPWKTPLDVFLEKTGQKEDQPDNENLWWGREMEPVLAKRYAKEKEINESLLVLPPALKNPMRHPKMPWYLGSPDCLIPTVFPKIAEIKGGVDFKTSGKPDEWGEPGTDEVPQQYIIQAEWYMGLTGAAWWDIAVLLMGFTRKFTIYRINRDNELIQGLIDAGERFWTDHVLTGIPPALDGSKSATEYLKKKYPSDLGPLLEPTDPEIIALCEQYREIRKIAKNWEVQESELANRLRNFIGDAAGMQGSWGKITWRKTKDSNKVDWERLAMSLNPSPKEMQNFTFTKPGPRRWLPKFTQED